MESIFSKKKLDIEANRETRLLSNTVELSKLKESESALNAFKKSLVNDTDEARQKAEDARQKAEDARQKAADEARQKAEDARQKAADEARQKAEEDRKEIERAARAEAKKEAERQARAEAKKEAERQAREEARKEAERQAREEAKKEAERQAREEARKEAERQAREAARQAAQRAKFIDPDYCAGYGEADSCIAIQIVNLQLLYEMIWLIEMIYPNSAVADRLLVAFYLKDEQLWDLCTMAKCLPDYEELFGTDYSKNLSWKDDICSVAKCIDDLYYIDRQLGKPLIYKWEDDICSVAKCKYETFNIDKSNSTLHGLCYGEKCTKI